MNALYARVSTEEQAKTGYSIQYQIDSCKKRFPDAKEYVDDGFSGEFLDRPAMTQLRHDLKAKLIKHVIMLDPDRMSRNLTHMLLISDEIEKSGAKLTFVTGDYETSPEGKLFFSIRGAVAAFEKAKIRERTMSGKKQKALSGKIIVNRTHYGYDWEASVSNYKINTHEANIVKQIYNWCINGATLNQIVKLLKNEKNKHGRNFNFKAVYKILTSEIYTGIYYEGKQSHVKIGQNKYKITDNPKDQWIPVSVPAIISVQEQEQAKNQLSQNFINSKRNAKHEYLLSGVLRCPDCGYSISASWYNDKKAYYICNGNKFHKKCNARYLPMHELDQRVWSEINYAAQHNMSLVEINQDQSDYSSEILKFQQKEKDIKENQAAIADLMLEKLLPVDEAKKRLQKLSKELNETIDAIRELTAVNAKQKSIELNKDELSHLLTPGEQNKYFKKIGLTVYAKRCYGTDEIKIKYVLE